MLREVAWNGVRFQAPDDWQPGSIGPRYLLLEADDGPVLELKWEMVSGRIHPGRMMRRLVAGRKRGVRFQRADLPEPWGLALSRFQVTGFSWESSGVNGIGALCCCPECGMATLVQVYRPGRDAAIDAAVPPLLASFSDHREDGNVSWSLYDLRAELPRTLPLIRHRFQPGRFQLTFGRPDREVSLWRWSPASVLLKDGGLAGFARKAFKPNAPRAVVFRDCDAVEYTPPFPGRAKRLALRLARPRVWWYRLWVAGTANRVLGVSQHGRRPVDPSILENAAGSLDASPPGGGF